MAMHSMHRSNSGALDHCSWARFSQERCTHDEHCRLGADQCRCCFNARAAERGSVWAPAWHRRGRPWKNHCLWAFKLVAKQRCGQCYSAGRCAAPALMAVHPARIALQLAKHTHLIGVCMHLHATARAT